MPRDLPLKMNSPKQLIKGFSLVEVLIFVTIFSLFFIIAATVITTTLRITKENQNKIKATHLAEELKEWLTSEKEINWGGNEYVSTVTSFTEQTTQSHATLPYTDFCFNDSPIPMWPNPGVSGCYMTLDGQFRRIATFSATPVGGYIKQVNAKIEVEWLEGAILKKVPVSVEFSVWE